MDSLRRLELDRRRRRRRRTQCRSDVQISEEAVYREADEHTVVETGIVFHSGRYKQIWQDPREHDGVSAQFGRNEQEGEGHAWLIRYLSVVQYTMWEDKCKCLPYGSRPDHELPVGVEILGAGSFYCQEYERELSDGGHIEGHFSNVPELRVRGQHEKGGEGSHHSPSHEQVPQPPVSCRIVFPEGGTELEGRSDHEGVCAQDVHL